MFAAVGTGLLTFTPTINAQLFGPGFKVTDPLRHSPLDPTVYGPRSPHRPGPSQSHVGPAIDPVNYYGIRNTTNFTVYYAVNRRPAQMSAHDSTRFSEGTFTLGFEGRNYYIQPSQTVVFYVDNYGRLQFQAQ